MKIFGWYLVGGCMGEGEGQRHVDSTLTLWPWNSLPLYLLNDFWWEDVSGGQRCVAWKNCVDATFDFDLETKIPFRSVSPKLRFLVDIWWEDVLGDIFGGKMYQETKVCCAEELCRCDIGPWSCDLHTEITFCSCLLNECRLSIDIWRNDVTRSYFVSQLHSYTSTCQFLELCQTAGMLPCVRARKRSI
jgi:hypothetical protein